MRFGLAALAVAAAATIALGGCAGGYYGHRDFIAADGDYDGFYDDFYGPVGDGYWGTDGAFFYSDAPGHPFHRDEAGHFRRDPANGFHAMHGHHSAGPAHGGHG